MKNFPEARSYRRLFSCLLLSLTFSYGCGVRSASEFFIESRTEKKTGVEEDFNYILGTQTIGARYQFTDDSLLVETSKAILNMGSRVLKTNLGGISQDDFDAIMRLPFHTYLFWYHGAYKWTDGLTDKEKNGVYQETVALATSLKRDFDGHRKNVYIGHWEGDWQLLQGYDVEKDPESIEIQGMIDWLNIRQRAIDDVNARFPGSDVKIFQYTEVNRVLDALDRGKKRVVNAVLPFVDVDYVSYSSYDVQAKQQEQLNRVMDYVVANMRPHRTISGKRLMVTEFGFSADVVGFDRLQHEQINRDIMMKFLSWGAPLILYWEMYNNEVVQERHRGFWLIDDKNEKWPLHDTIHSAHSEGRQFVMQMQRSEGRIPSQREYQLWLKDFLASIGR